MCFICKLRLLKQIKVKIDKGAYILNTSIEHHYLVYVHEVSKNANDFFIIIIQDTKQRSTN